MKNLDWYKKAFLLLKNPKLLRNDKSYIFVLGHMRARSSVFSHVLGSHPEILGYTELHRNYKSPSSLLKMRVDIYEEFGDNFDKKYILDKILHNGLDPSLKTLKAANPKLIFLLREPAGYAKSLVKLGERVGKKHYANPDFAVEHYILRVKELMRLADTYNEKFFFVESDSLINDTDTVLEKLSTFLELETPLSSDYKQFEKTGKRRFGDSSSNISSGKIQNTASSGELDVTPEAMPKAIEIYNQCKEHLEKHHLNAAK